MMNQGPMMDDPSMMQGGMPPEQGMDPSMMGQDPSMMQPPEGQAMMEPQEGTPEDAPEDKMENFLDYALSQANLAKKLSKTKKGKETLQKMSEELLTGYEDDEQSRSDWMAKNEEWMNMALLIREAKTYPWPKSSNVKYPLLATAAMQFSARAYPALVPADGEIVKTRVVQDRVAPEIYDAAKRVSNHMSFQIFERLPNWEEDMDKLLMTIAISGLCYKKTYHNALDGVHNSCLVYPENLCVNYWAKSIEQAYRKTEILYYTQNDLQAKVNNDEEFLDLDYPVAKVDKEKKESVAVTLQPSQQDKSTPHVFLAVHTYWDLDDDGYEEPYIITIHKESKQICRITARWDSDGVKRSADGKIIKIKPVEYFTAFPFIPNPDGSIYALGFGILLGPLNESINTIINQLVDAGTLANMQAGFIGKGLRLQMKNQQFTPGEWKVVNATGDDLHKQIVPLPIKEPSGVLFNLLNMLIQSGNQLASIAEIMVGKMPGQNTPAGTTQEAVQQGMAVFTAIYKRVYRSLFSEYKKLYRLNRITPDILEEEIQLSGIPLEKSDYELPDWVILPGADPVGDSQQMQQNKMQQVGQLLQLQTLDPMAFTKRVLKINDIPQAEELLAKPPEGPPPPSPEEIKAQTQVQVMQQKAALDTQKGQQDMELKKEEAGLRAFEKQMELRHTEQMQAIQLQGERQRQEMDTVLQTIMNHFEGVKARNEVAVADVQHRQKLRQGEEAHQVAMKQKSQQAQQQQKQAKATKKKSTAK